MYVRTNKLIDMTKQVVFGRSRLGAIVHIVRRPEQKIDIAQLGHVQSSSRLLPVTHNFVACH